MSGPAASGPVAIDPTLAYFQACLARLGVDWCVAGAVAANAYRAPRDTTDLDLIVQVAANRYTTVAERLRTDGWRVFRVSPASDYPDVVRLEHDDYFPTDLLLVKTAYQREALQRAHMLPSGVRILAPEDVIIHKLIAYRHRDRADVTEVLRSGTLLDHGYIERWAEEWGVLERWREAAAEAVR